MKKIEIKSLRNQHFEKQKPDKTFTVKDLIAVLSALTEEDQKKLVVVMNYEYGCFEPIRSIRMPLVDDDGGKKPYSAIELAVDES